MVPYLSDHAECIRGRLPAAVLDVGPLTTPALDVGAPGINVGNHSWFT